MIHVICTSEVNYASDEKLLPTVLREAKYGIFVHVKKFQNFQIRFSLINIKMTLEISKPTKN